MEEISARPDQIKQVESLAKVELEAWVDDVRVILMTRALELEEKSPGLDPHKYVEEQLKKIETLKLMIENLYLSRISKSYPPDMDIAIRIPEYNSEIEAAVAEALVSGEDRRYTFQVGDDTYRVSRIPGLVLKRTKVDDSARFHFREVEYHLVGKLPEDVQKRLQFMLGTKARAWAG